MMSLTSRHTGAAGAGTPHSVDPRGERDYSLAVSPPAVESPPAVSLHGSVWSHTQGALTSPSSLRSNELLTSTSRGPRPHNHTRGTAREHEELLRYAPHPTERFVAGFLSCDASMRASFDAATERFLVRYESLSRTVGSASASVVKSNRGVGRGSSVSVSPTESPIDALAAALHGLSLLLACDGAVRERAARVMVALLRSPAMSHEDAVPLLFSIARDLVVTIAVRGGIDDGDDVGGDDMVEKIGSAVTVDAAADSDDVLAALETVALRIAGADRLGALSEFDDEDVAEFAQKCTMLDEAMQDSAILAEAPDLRSALATTMDAFKSLRRKSSNAGSHAVSMAVNAVQRQRGMTITIVATPTTAKSQQSGDKGSSLSNAVEVVDDAVTAIDTAVRDGDIVAAELSISVLGLFASRSQDALAHFMVSTSDRLANATWPSRLAHTYTRMLAQVALGGHSSVVRRMSLDPTVPGSLADITTNGTGWLRVCQNTSHAISGTMDIGPRPREGSDVDEGAQQARMIRDTSVNISTTVTADGISNTTPSDSIIDHDIEWAVVKALLIIKHGGVGLAGYGWLVDAANAALVSFVDVDKMPRVSMSGAARGALDRRARDCAAAMLTSGGPFGIELALCATPSSVRSRQAQESGDGSKVTHGLGEQSEGPALIGDVSIDAGHVSREHGKDLSRLQVDMNDDTDAHAANAEEASASTPHAPRQQSRATGPRQKSVIPRHRKTVPSPPKIDAVTRNSNSLRLMLGAQMLRSREK